ncbi:MAG: iron complex outerrane recepter protein [Burkholderiales bacterium]|jgi:iron complex outermembrane receptor protein
MKQQRIAMAVAAIFLPATFAVAADEVMPEIRTTAARVRPGSPNDVVVTGSKTDTQLKDLPAAVVVVPSTLLREQGVLDMNRALDNASGVQPVMGGGYGFANNYTIRGLPMRFLRDGYPDGPSQNGYWRTVYDIDRIEVLKGPGSALYGSGQPGGSVNVVTKPPRKGFGAEVGALVGSFNTRGTYADVWGSVGPNLAARLIADVEKSDGFRRLGRDIKEISPSFTWSIDADKSLTLDFDHRDIKVTPDNYGILFDSRARVASVPRETRYYSPMNFANQKIDRITASHDWRITGDLIMRTALVHDRRDLDMLRNAGGNGGNAANQFTGRSIRSQSDDARSTMLQNEFVWKTRSGSIGQTVLAGVEYNATDIDTVRVGYNLPNIANIFAPVVPEATIAGLAPVASQGFNRKLSSNTWGVYLQDQVEFGEQFKVRAGVRGDRVRADDVGSQGTVAARRIEVHDTLTSGALGAVWQPTRDLSLYAGYSSGAFVNVATESTALSVEPEKSTQKEVGVKATFLDGRADANVAVFDTTRDHFYITLPGALSPTPDGKERTRGIELDLSARPLAGLSLLANLTLQDPQTESNALASNPILGVTNRSIAGTLPTGVAKKTARLWGTYEFQNAALKGWGFGMGATYKGDSYADNLNLYKVPGYTIYDAALFYRTKKWDASLNLRNLTDRTYYSNPTFAGALPGESRNAMLAVRMSFE